MFPPNPLINLIILSCLARAQEHHPIELGDIVVEATHVHFIVRVSNPEDIKGFMERFKTESAHAINRLLGRGKRTVWCAGYDSPVLLTADDVVDKIAYIYENPSKDGLEDSIDKYPGVSGFHYRGQDSAEIEVPLLSRDDIKPLPAGPLEEEDYIRLAEEISRDKKKIALKLFPNAWMKCFGIKDQSEVISYNERISTEIRSRESRHRDLRAKERSRVIGRQGLVQTPIGGAFQPKRTGRRMWCICCDKDIRKEFISWIKGLVVRAREVLASWRSGALSVPYPVGLYPPTLPKTAELIFC